MGDWRYIEPMECGAKMCVLKLGSISEMGSGLTEVNLSLNSSKNCRRIVKML